MKRDGIFSIVDRQGTMDAVGFWELVHSDRAENIV